MTEHTPHHDDDALAGRLRDVVAQIDPVPHAVTEFALAAIDSRTLDAEIAELVYDSAADADQAALVRSGKAHCCPSRQASFPSSWRSPSVATAATSWGS